MTLKIAASLGRLLNVPRPGLNFVHLADQLDQAVLLIAPHTGTVVHANHAATALTGYSRTELARLTLQILFPAGQAPDLLEQLTRPDSGLPRILLNQPLATRSGREVMADLTASRIGSGPDASLLILAEDASRRLNEERAAVSRSQALKALDGLISLNLAPDGTSIGQAITLVQSYMGACGAGMYQALPGQPGLKLVAGVDLNPAFPDRISPDEVAVLMAPQKWVSTRRAQHTLSQAARYAGWAALLTYPVGEKPGQIGLLLVGYRSGQQGFPLSMLGIAARQVYLLLRQVARQNAFHQIAANHQAVSSQFQSLLQQIREAVIVIDAERRVQYVNSSACRLLSYEPDEAVNLPFEDLLVSPQGLTAAILTALRQGKPASAARITLHSRSGESFPAAVRVEPLVVGDGQESPSGVMVVVKDQSERVAFERRSHQLEQRALVGQLAAILAHEVRNPINNISALAQLMASRLEPDSPLHKDLTTLQAETRRLVRLLTDVLKISRPLEIEVKPHSLGNVVERVLDRWAPRLARLEVTVQRKFDPATPLALIDTRSIERVLTNLLSNALHAMPEGGTLSVFLHPLDTGPADRRPAGRRPMVELQVSDTGRGMDEETQARVFDPFFTKTGGTGLGLSITRHIVHTVHKGTISVESFPGTGSVFTVRLPAADVEEASEEN